MYRKLAPAALVLSALVIPSLSLAIPQAEGLEVYVPHIILMFTLSQSLQTRTRGWSGS